MTTHYFSLRSKLEPAPSAVPILILTALTLLTIFGLFVDIGASAQI